MDLIREKRTGSTRGVMTAQLPTPPLNGTWPVHPDRAVEPRVDVFPLPARAPVALRDLFPLPLVVCPDVVAMVLASPGPVPTMALSTIR